MIRVDTAAHTLSAFGVTYPCAIGRAGAGDGDAKREGDGMTPHGHYAVRTILARRGRTAITTAMPFRWLRPDDGWSDDPADPAYNRPVRHPHRWSAEQLWRDDGLYDLIVTLAHNDSPPQPGLGSAIFLHCWNDGNPTEGCVAIDRVALIAIVEQLKPGARIEIC